MIFGTDRFLDDVITNVQMAGDRAIEDLMGITGLILPTVPKEAVKLIRQNGYDILNAGNRGEDFTIYYELRLNEKIIAVARVQTKMPYFLGGIEPNNAITSVHYGNYVNGDFKKYDELTEEK